MASRIAKAMGIVFLLCYILLPISSHAQQAARVVRLATTTTTVNSGLLAHLLPAFEKSTGYKVEMSVFGSGKALNLGRMGKVDVLLVHAPADEEEFMRQGYGLKRYYLMKNHFIIVGPDGDPAHIADTHYAIDAFTRIAHHQSPFISRGDDSGTHQMELSIWSDSDIIPYGAWYIEVGMTMGDALAEASREQAYTLTDNGTWLAKKQNLNLVKLLEGDPRLDNPYHIITVNPENAEGVNTVAARVLTQWLLSDEAQTIINNYRVMGTRLFIPARYQK